MTDLSSWGVASDSPTAEHYRTFGSVEARGSSDTYEGWALGVADDAEMLALIDELPRAKRQANLVFAAMRVVGVPIASWQGARGEAIARWPRIREVALTHATQTNEAARCAVLLPQLARIPGPLALLEVGASAGLCLYPDRYTYRYTAGDGTVTRIDPVVPTDVVIDCRIENTAPPTHLPDVVWRGGIDLNPLDPADPDTLAWLDALVWPEHEDRRARLRAAMAVAASDPAPIRAGDLNDLIADAAASAPVDATLVVFHTAVLAYLSPEDRERFRRTMADTDAVWLSNEGLGVFPEFERIVPPGERHRFVLAVDGEPVALTHPHGRSYRGL
ncbi:DUF2332 domain-containing protein [Microbacterium sp. 77mftsu3.1]|uniref:DUF2332 domain-containing protein n=1 Tax=Microbacterium sp. 77mftsu3.1 TaxID=1761802 RepID=UPI000362F26F|nr:DUF2332 domain-containing protein [Microbacterium sp. 77mftsu3.1]SDG61365.1 hypothetical protein SAMN04488590_1286 [Microbacterium sp. 77mftsu3.1]